MAEPKPSPKFYIKELELQPVSLRLTVVPFGGDEQDGIAGYRIGDKACLSPTLSI